MTDISLPDGRIIRLTGQETPEQLSALRQKLKDGQSSKKNFKEAKAFGVALSGGQLPFGQVITSGLAAGALTPFLGQDGEAIPETYQRLYGEAQDYTQRLKEQYPAATTAGNIAGIASTLPAAFGSGGGGGLGAARDVINKGVTSARDFAGKVAGYSPFQGKYSGAANLVTRGLGSAAVAAPVTGLYAAGEAAPGERGQAFAEGAGMGALVGASLPVAGAALTSSAGGLSNIAKGISARGEDALQYALENIKDASRALYQEADNSGLAFAPESLLGLAGKLSKVVKSGDVASKKLYSKTLGAIDDLFQDLSQGNTGLMTLDRHRQILGNIGKDITNPNKAQEAEAANRAIGIIDDFIDKAGEKDITGGAGALVEARALWSKSKKFEKVADIINGAAGDANKLKRDLEKFRLNPKNTLGWSDAEKEALKTASTQTTGEGVLKMMGKFGFDLGSGRGVGNTALPILGGALTGASTTAGLGAAVPIVGTAARAAQKSIAAGKAEELLRVIEQGGNVSKKMIDSLPDQEKKKFLSSVMALPMAKAKSILEGKK